MADRKEAAEIVEEVKAEIKKMGDGQDAIKENYTKLNTSLEEFKTEVEKQNGKVKGEFDTIVDDKLVKLAEDVTTRQEAIDAKFAETATAEDIRTANTRMDDMEIAMKRTGKSSDLTHDEQALEVKDALKFRINNMAVKAQDKGVTPTEIDALEDVNMEEYADYKKAFPSFLRVNDRTPKSIDPAHVKALSAGIDPDGGYTVTPMMSNRIISRLFESDPIRQLAASESITTGVLEWMVDFDQAGAGWEAETVAGAETDTPQFFKKRIPVHVQYAKPQASQTLLEDSGINIEAWLADKVANRFMRLEAAAFVTGAGVGLPRGFLTYADGSGYGTIERTNMQAAAALTADGFIAVKYSLIEQYLARCTWLMNRTTVRDAMYLKDGEGRYIWKPGFQDDSTSSILGLPVRMSTTMPAVASGVQAVALADWKEAYMIVDRLGITIQRDPFTVKPMVEFYTRRRVGGDVVNYQAIKLGNIAA